MPGRYQNVPVVTSYLAAAKAALGRRMAEYRAYLIVDDGHFMRAVDIFCDEDEVAKERAKQLVDATMWSFGSLIEK